jgi:MbtH protein
LLNISVALAGGRHRKTMLYPYGFAELIGKTEGTRSMDGFSLSEEELGQIQAVSSREEQHSIWPTDRDSPLDWNDVGKSSTKAERLAYIEEVWSGMGPLSLRLKMATCAKGFEISGEMYRSHISSGANSVELWSTQFESAVRASLLSVEPGVRLSSTTTLADLHLDSLSVMVLVTSLEQSFNITLPQDVLVRGPDTTLGDLWSCCTKSARTNNLEAGP